MLKQHAFGRSDTFDREPHFTVTAAFFPYFLGVAAGIVTIEHFAVTPFRSQ